MYKDATLPSYHTLIRDLTRCATLARKGVGRFFVCLVGVVFHLEFMYSVITDDGCTATQEASLDHHSNLPTRLAAEATTANHAAAVNGTV